MAIKIKNSTIIDDSRNIVNAGVTTVTSVSIGNTQVISSSRQLQNIVSLDATTTATIESAISNAPNTFTDLNVSGITTVGFITATNLNVSGVGTFLSSGLRIRNPANTFEYTIAGSAIVANRNVTLPLAGADITLASTDIASQTFSGTNTFSGSVSFTGANVTINPSSANGNFTLGNTAGTGSFIVGQSTATQQTNIQAGASGVGTTKTINFGTGGLSGSFTQINIGPSAGVGTIVINSGTNLGIGSTTPTVPLDVVGNAKISGVVTATTFSGSGINLTGIVTSIVAGTNVTISGSTGQVTINATGGGGGESYWTSTTVGIHTLSNVGIGTTNPTSKLHVQGDVLFTGVTTTSRLNVGTGGTVITTTASGLVGIGTTNPTTTLQVQGTTRITGITSIRDVTIDKSIASPNATVPVAIIGVTTSGISTETNIDVVLLAKGTGATLAQIPDGTAAGGDKRGQYATDWQKQRLGSTRVASGNYSTIGGGYTNTAAGLRATVAGGNDNSASGQDSAVCGGNDNITSSNFSFIGGGQTNRAQTDTHATVCGGQGNTASGQHSFIGGGSSNTCSGLTAFMGGGTVNNVSGGRAVIVGGSENTNSGGWSFLGGGQNNTITSTYSVVCGGYLNTANAQFSFIAAGTSGTTRSIVGYHVFPACYQPISSTQGSTQSALLLLGRQTTDATATVLTSNSSAASTTNQVILPNNSAYFFKGSCIAGVTGAGNTKAWEFKGAIKRGANAASTSIVGSVIKDVIASDAGASTWDITITADTTNGGIKVEVTGQASTTIRWVCKIETTEMTY